MRDNCDHLLQLKSQKVANYFAKAGNCCTGNKKHSDCSQLGMCLTCGEVRCDNQQYQCTYQHSYGTKHPLIFKITEGTIFCFPCQTQIGEQLLQIPENSKRQKIAEQYEKILKMSEKIGEKAQTYKIESTKKEKKDTFQLEHSAEKREVEKEQLEVQERSKAPYKIEVFGLKNLGNTCFFNSILQCLYSCQELHSQYCDIPIDGNRQFGKIGQISILFSKFLRSKERCFSPKAVFSWICKMKSAYKNMGQQDAQQVLALILNGLIDGEHFWMGTKSQHHQKISPTEKHFGLFLSSRLQCLACQKVSWAIDFSLQIAVHLNKFNEKAFKLPEGEIPQQQIKGQGLRYPPEKNSGTFLDVFFASESLCSKNYFECEHCGADKAWRKFYIKDPPSVLIISLKRFNNNLSKNNAVVKTPYRLDLEGHCLNPGPLQYELFAISEHAGSSRGGHYVAHTRRGNEWYYFSDGNVKGETWDRVRSSQPYILFYRRIK